PLVRARPRAAPAPPRPADGAAVRHHGVPARRGHRARADHHVRAGHRQPRHRAPDRPVPQRARCPRPVRPRAGDRPAGPARQPRHARDRAAGAALAPVRPAGDAAMTAVRRTLASAGFTLGLPLLLLLGWAVATRSTTTIYFPTPARVGEAFVATWLDPEILGRDVLPSLGRFAIGVALSIVIGIAAGTVIGSTPWLRALLEPMLEFFRAIPPVVLVPVLMLVLGLGDTMRLAVIVSGSVWPVLLNTVEGVRARDPVLVDTSRSYRVRGALALRYFVLPAASPQIMAGIRLCLSIGLILMVISEMFAA